MRDTYASVSCKIALAEAAKAEAWKEKNAQRTKRIERMKRFVSELSSLFQGTDCEQAIQELTSQWAKQKYNKEVLNASIQVEGVLRRLQKGAPNGWDALKKQFGVTL